MSSCYLKVTLITKTSRLILFTGTAVYCKNRMQHTIKCEGKTQSILMLKLVEHAENTEYYKLNMSKGITTL
jgi:hypothetical protein